MRRLVALLAVGQLWIACSDDGGKEAAAAIRLQLEEPVDGLQVEGREVLVRGSADADHPLTRISYRVNGQEQQSDSPVSKHVPIEKRLVLPREGENRIEVVATDEKGHEGRIARTVQSTAQVVTIDSFVASATGVRPGGPVELSWVVHGSPPIEVELEGIGIVEGENVRVHPATSTTYRLKVRNAHGLAGATVEVAVEPELVPQLRTVTPGQVQRLWVAGTEAEYEILPSGGSIETNEYGDIYWNTPEEPGHYEIRVKVPGHDDIVHPVEVRAAEAVEARWIGRGGQPGLRWDDQVVADPDGSLWAVGHDGVLHKQPGEVWTFANAGIDFDELREIVRSPDGIHWIVGSFWDGAGRTCAIARWDGARWVRDDGSAWPSGSRCIELRFGADGTHYVTEYRDAGESLRTRPGPGADWSALPTPPVRLQLVGPDGALYGFCSDGCRDPSGSNVFRLAPGAQRWEGLGHTIEYPTNLSFDPTGALVVSGVGLMRLGEDGVWQDLRAGLPGECATAARACWVEGIAHHGDKTFVVTQGGLSVREGDGAFTLLAGLPVPEALSFGLRGLVANEAGDLWILGNTGLWRLPAGETTFRFEGDEGLPGNNLNIAAMAIADDGTVAVGTWPIGGVDLPLVALRDSAAAAWRAAGPPERTSGDEPLSLLFEPDGTLLSWSRGSLLRIQRDGSFATGPTDGLPAANYWSPLARLGDGTLVTVPDFDQPYRLEPGASSWTPLPEHEGINGVDAAPDGSVWATTTFNGDGVVRLGPGESEWTSAGAGPFGLGYTPMFSRVQWAPDGTAWARTQEGIVRLEEGVWRHVGSGVCSFWVNDLVVTRSGLVLCLASGDLYLLDPQEERWERFADQAPGTFVKLVDEAPDGALWVRMDGGIYEVRLR